MIHDVRVLSHTQLQRAIGVRAVRGSQPQLVRHIDTPRDTIRSLHCIALTTLQYLLYHVNPYLTVHLNGAFGMRDRDDKGSECRYLR